MCCVVFGLALLKGFYICIKLLYIFHSIMVIVRRLLINLLQLKLSVNNSAIGGICYCEILKNNVTPLIGKITFGIPKMIAPIIGNTRNTHKNGFWIQHIHSGICDVIDRIRSSSILSIVPPFGGIFNAKRRDTQRFRRFRITRDIGSREQSLKTFPYLPDFVLDEGFMRSRISNTTEIFDHFPQIGRNDMLSTSRVSFHNNSWPIPLGQ